jgi:hypothetical protein
MQRLKIKDLTELCSKQYSSDYRKLVVLFFFHHFALLDPQTNIGWGEKEENDRGGLAFRGRWQ